MNKKVKFCRRCHTSYTTTFEAQQEEDCEENYIKKCYIAYENFAFNETVEVRGLVNTTGSVWVFLLNRRIIQLW